MDKIGHLGVAETVQFVRMTVEAFLDLFEQTPEKRGGQFYLIDRLSREDLFVKAGKCSAERMEKCALTAKEKAERLLDFATSHRHISSFQSRNSTHGQWGGAILGEQYVLSFSGLPELGDEAVVLVVAYRLGLASLEAISKIVQISQNPFFERLNDSMAIRLTTKVCCRPWGRIH